MIPRSLSASSIQNFEGCPARWKADYMDRAPAPNNTAASLGTACHEALEGFVGFTLKQRDGEPAGPDTMHHVARSTGKVRAKYQEFLLELFETAYWKLFPNDERLQEGRDLLIKWLKRQDADAWPENRSIVSLETKTNFPLKTSAGEIPFNYIFDRLDRIDHPDGTFEMEVVDYKTTALPLGASKLKGKIQARAYAVAVMIAFPEAARVWVTFDQLRHDPVGIVFTRDENRAAWRYLKATAERIIATPESATDDDGNEHGPPEMLNPECRWCVRAPVCESLKAHADAGGVLGITDPQIAAERLLDIDSQMGGLRTLQVQYGEILMAHCADEDTLELTLGGVEVTVGSKRTRKVDGDLVKRALPPEVAAEYGSIGVTTVDKILRDDRVSDEAKAEIRGLIGVTFSEPSVKVKAVNPMDEDD